MGGLTPPKKPSASQMRQKALKCTVELEIQAVSILARVSFSTKTKIFQFACVIIGVFVLAYCQQQVAITEDRVGPSDINQKVATSRNMLIINIPAFTPASDVFITNNAQAKILDFQPSCQHILELLLLFCITLQRIIILREIIFCRIFLFYTVIKTITRQTFILKRNQEQEVVALHSEISKTM